MSDLLKNLLSLSHNLGSEARGLAMLGEGNTSARIDKDRFLVKASGTSLGTLREEDVVECHSAPLLALIAGAGAMEDKAVDQALLDCRVDKTAKKPSVEALFHGYLLSLEGINYVGHTHPITANGLLCSPVAREVAETRLFPDEIVCCGRRSVFVPYTDPGLVLAKAIRDGVEKFVEEEGEKPRVILLQNHGVITLGGSPQAVEAAMYMTEKAAKIRLAAISAGSVITFTEEQINRISNRPDEHQRRAMLKI